MLVPMPWGLPRKLFAVFTHIMLRAMVRHNRDRASAWSGEPGGAHVIMAWYMVCAGRRHSSPYILVHVVLLILASLGIILAWGAFHPHKIVKWSVAFSPP